MSSPELPWIIVGLGNPGPAYAENRHNVGAMVVRQLAERYGDGLIRAGRKREPTATFRTHRSRALVSEVRLGDSSARTGPKVVLALPTTFMNDSGGAVKALMKYFSVGVDRLVLVHDELDIPAGVVRVKGGGGEGGHNGLRSVSAAVGTRDYLRVRVGIGRPNGRMDPAEFVLRDFTAVEREELPVTLARAGDAAESLVRVGLLATQQEFHSG